MFKVTTTGDGRVDIELDGELDAMQMRQALDELELACVGIEHGTMLYTIKELKMPTVGAMVVELSRIPLLISMVGNFDKAAVLADQGWVKTWSKIEGAIIPGLDIKAFDLSQRVEAESWLAS